MRPRLLHLGSVATIEELRAVPAASMRPRLLHLGSRPAIRWPSGGSLSFNEAEAFTPRIRG